MWIILCLVFNLCGMWVKWRFGIDRYWDPDAGGVVEERGKEVLKQSLRDAGLEAHGDWAERKERDKGKWHIEVESVQEGARCASNAFLYMDLLKLFLFKIFCHETSHENFHWQRCCTWSSICYLKSSAFHSHRIPAFSFDKFSQISLG